MRVTAKQLDQLLHAEEGISNGEKCRVITVRMPDGLHEALKSEAHRFETSLNRLALAKLRITGEPFHDAIAATVDAGYVSEEEEED